MKQFLRKQFAGEKWQIGGLLFLGLDGVKKGPNSSFLASVFHDLGALQRKKTVGNYYLYAMENWTMLDELFATCPPAIDPKMIKVPKARQTGDDEGNGSS